MDWVKKGFGPNYLSFHSTLPFYLNYHNAIPTPNKSVLHLAKEAIERIASNYPAPYTLMCSGGIDSQAMILAWKYSGVPFNIVSARYNNNLNDHDLSELKLLSSRENLDVTYLDIDVIDFHETQLEDWAKRFNCTSPQILTHMYIASKITTGTVISSGHYVLKTGFGTTPYGVFGLHRYSQISGQSMIPYFWMHDQYLMPAFELLRREHSDTNLIGVTHDYAYKVLLFNLAGIGVIPQTTKYNGFENLKERYDHIKFSNMQLLRIKSKNRDPSLRSYDIMFRHRLEEITPCYGLTAMTVLGW